MNDIYFFYDNVENYVIQISDVLGASLLECFGDILSLDPIDAPEPNDRIEHWTLDDVIELLNASDIIILEHKEDEYILFEENGEYLSKYNLHTLETEWSCDLSDHYDVAEHLLGDPKELDDPEQLPPVDNSILDDLVVEDVLLGAIFEKIHTNTFTLEKYTNSGLVVKTADGRTYLIPTRINA